MKILIYTTHRTGSTSLANFLMFNLNCDYQRFNYFKDNFNKLPSDIVIKLTPNEISYESISNMFDKKIVLTRNDVRLQSESRVYATKVKKMFSSYKISEDFLKKYEKDIDDEIDIIDNENNILRNCKDCLHITYEELYKSNDGVIKLEKYLDVNFKYEIQYKPYRNMVKSLI